MHLNPMAPHHDTLTFHPRSLLYILSIHEKLPPTTSWRVLTADVLKGVPRSRSCCVHLSSHCAHPAFSACSRAAVKNICHRTKHLGIRQKVQRPGYSQSREAASEVQRRCCVELYNLLVFGTSQSSSKHEYRLVRQGYSADLFAYCFRC